MNERIRALALQSGYGARWTTTEQFEQFVDKFAELIVRECAQVADERPDVLVDNSTAGLILQHFGVKE